MHDRRSLERETRLMDEKVFGVSFGDIISEAVMLAQRDGFVPSLYPKGKVLASEVSVVVMELTAFAAINLLRKRNGLEALTKVPPLVSLGELAPDSDELEIGEV